jgi:hypothetical protein
VTLLGNRTLLTGAEVVSRNKARSWAVLVFVATTLASMPLDCDRVLNKE